MIIRHLAHAINPSMRRVCDPHVRPERGARQLQPRRKRGSLSPPRIHPVAATMARAGRQWDRGNGPQGAGALFLRDRTMRGATWA